jgi:hypothetical protein
MRARSALACCFSAIADHNVLVNVYYPLLE